MTTTKHWYLVMAKPKQDKVAEENLVLQGYEVYRPQATQTVMQRGKPVEKKISLFPRCLFIRLSKEEDNWAPLRSTKGVLEMVRLGANYAKISDEVITSLKAREADDIAKNQSEPSQDAALEMICSNQDADQRMIAFMRLVSAK